MSRPATTVLTAPKKVTAAAGAFGRTESGQCGADDDLEHVEGIHYVIADGVLGLGSGFLVDGAFVDTLVGGGTCKSGIGAKDGGRLDAY